MRRFTLYVAAAVLVVVPGLVLRIAGTHLATPAETLIAGTAILAAGFMLSWGLEAAEEHVSRGLALAGLALITVLPEYVVDIYYAFQGGRHPESEYVQFAAANMTGANRLLVGIGWPLVVLLYWWRSGRHTVELRLDSSVEVAYLGLGSLYSFVIVLKGQIDWVDCLVLFGIFAAYLWRLGKLPKHNADDDDEEDEKDETEVGPAAVLARLPRRRQYAIIAGLASFAALAIFVEAEPFAESLIGTAAAFGIDKFLVIQWISPLAGEVPEIVITILFALSLRPGHALGALISDKINQWTLLVGTLPLAYSMGGRAFLALPLDARQQEEFFLTAAQSLFALALLLRLRFGLTSASILLLLFLGQLGTSFVFQGDERESIYWLTVWRQLLFPVTTIKSAAPYTAAGSSATRVFDFAPAALAR